MQPYTTSSRKNNKDDKNWIKGDPTLPEISCAWGEELWRALYYSVASKTDISISLDMRLMTAPRGYHAKHGAD